MITGRRESSPFEYGRLRMTDDELLDIFASEALVDRASLVREASLADIGISSLDLMSVLFEVEEKFNVRVEEADLENCKNLGDVLDYLKARVNSSATS